MGFRLNGFPARPSDEQQVALDGTAYLARFTYRERTASWYLDLSLLDGTALIRGRRLSPGWSPSIEMDVQRLPGLLIVRGTDDFERLDLGTDDLAVVYYDGDEISSAAPVDPNAPTFTAN